MRHLAASLTSKHENHWCSTHQDALPSHAFGIVVRCAFPILFLLQAFLFSLLPAWGVAMSLQTRKSRLSADPAVDVQSLQKVLDGIMKSRGTRNLRDILQGALPW